MADTTEIRKGLCIEYNHDIYTVTEFLHVKPGKGPAFVRTTLKSLTNGRVIDNTFPSGHKIEIVRVERRKFQYLYEDEVGYNFMDNETYEQIVINTDLITNAKLMKEGIEVEVLFDANKQLPMTVELPQKVVLKVTYTEPGIKGNTATNATKPATMETGAEVRVPLFINTDEMIVVDTEKGTYVERAK
jgi:elongation factor P